MGQGASFCERRRGSCPPLAHVDIAHTGAATSSSVGSTLHSTLAHSKFEQSLCQVLHDHRLHITSNVYYDKNFELLEDTTAFHNAKNFVWQVHLQGLKRVPEVKNEWETHKQELDERFRKYSSEVDKWFEKGLCNQRGDKIKPPVALGPNGVLYEVDIMSKGGNAVPHDLPIVPVKMDGQTTMLPLRDFITEHLNEPALIEVTLESSLSERKQGQIKRLDKLAKKMKCKSVLFYNGMQHAAIQLDEEVETLAVWISQELVETFANRKLSNMLEELRLQGTNASMQSKTVWVRQLRKDDSGGFELVGNAFQVKDKDMKNIDDLKEAIKKKMELSIAAPLIDIYSQKAIEKEEKLSIAPSKIEIVSRQEDGNWSKEEKMSEPLRDNDEATPYGYTVP